MVWHIAHGPCSTTSRPRACSGADRIRRRLRVGRRASARSRPALRRRRSAPCARAEAPQYSAHWPRKTPGCVGAQPAACCRGPGTRSILPCRFGTQKLWITSVACSVNRDRPADRHVDLVRGRHLQRWIGVLVLDAPPPLVAGDLHVKRDPARERAERAAGEHAREQQADQRDGRDDRRRRRRCGSASTAGVARGAARRRLAPIATASASMTATNTAVHIQNISHHSCSMRAAWTPPNRAPTGSVLASSVPRLLRQFALLPRLRLLRRHVVVAARRRILRRLPAHRLHVGDELPDLLVGNRARRTPACRSGAPARSSSRSGRATRRRSTCRPSAADRSPPPPWRGSRAVVGGVEPLAFAHALGVVLVRALQPATGGCGLPGCEVADAPSRSAPPPAGSSW